MNTDSRTKNVGKNVTFNLLCQLFNILLSFVSRTVFIKILGAEYLGINGLFTNILTILSFAELGVGSAIIFNMYRPIAEGDKAKLRSLMRLYQKAYIAIGCFILVMGILLLPCINFFIAEKPNIPENLSIIYVLFLINAASSYFFLYKRSIITADQRDYIAVVIEQIVTFIRTIVQILILVLFRKYILYLVIQVIGTIVSNALIANKADRLYPFLKEKADPLSSGEKKQIFTNIKALVIYRLGSVVLNGTDNLIISSMLGVIPVGLTSNYLLITTTFNSLLVKIKDAFVASIGNLNATENSEKSYNIFKKLLMLCFWLYGLCAVGIILLGSDFIELWIGNDYILPEIVVVSIALSFYESGVHFAAYTYRTTLGYFVEGRFAPLCAAILNIVLSVLLCKLCGLSGIFFATVISRSLTFGIIDPYLIYSKSFHKPLIEYYKQYGGYLILHVIITLICKVSINLVAITGISGLILKIVIVVGIYNGIMLLALAGNPMFKEIIITLLRNVKMRKGSR